MTMIYSILDDNDFHRFVHDFYAFRVEKIHVLCYTDFMSDQERQKKAWSRLKIRTIQSAVKTAEEKL
jgi:hypothetical protein